MALGLAGALASACGGSSDSGSGGTGSIKFSLDYQIDGLHAPMFVARDKGYYKQNKLDVTINPSGGSRDSIARVAAGQVQLGVASPDTAVLAMASKNVKIKVVGVLLQHSTAATVTLKSSGITKPADLKGKTIGDAPASSVHAFFPAFLGANGMKPSDVKPTALSSSSISPTLLAGKVQAVNNFLQTFAKVSDQISVMPWYQHGIDSYGSTIIANEDYLKSHGDEVRRFLDATYKGLTYTIAQPADAGKIVGAAAHNDPGFYTKEIGMLQPFWEIKGAQQSQYGRMTDDCWKITQDLTVKYAGQSKALPLTQIYTNEYLPAG